VFDSQLGIMTVAWCFCYYVATRKVLLVVGFMYPSL